MWMKRTAATLLLLAAFVQSVKLPDWLVPCYRDDPGFNDCARQHGQAAIPKVVQGQRYLRMPSLDPLEIIEIHVDKDVTMLGIDLYVRDVKLSGFGDMELRDFRVDFEKRHITMNLFAPDLNFLCTYEVSGKFFLLPISGTGPGNVTSYNVLVDYDLDYDLKTKSNGKEYIALKNGLLKFNSTRAVMRFDNLLGGNKELGDNLNTLLEDNWQELLLSLGPPVSQTLELAVKRVFVRLTALFTFDQIFPLKPK